MRILVNVKTPLLRKAERYGISVHRVMHDALAAAVAKAEAVAPVKVSDRIAVANLCVATAAEDWADILHMAGVVAPVLTMEERNGVRHVVADDGWLVQVCTWLTKKPAEVRIVTNTAVTIWRELADATGLAAKSYSRRTPKHLESAYADAVATLADDMAKTKAALATHVGDVAPRRRA
ncbi:hypothetical protein [Nonomuraea endophytica]|uniref:Uncharacterized protein n=1 Tax=Nonomuraea endophytica TaxID=714136 RepID=A0A7W8A833_9ACTN|nr:hypothetical protein [Nonomuraea endophytica]MBB5081347.1 hypothetical protein [Nonomuraea endophytica]